jgi:isopentenyl phosphate kinase
MKKIVLKLGGSVITRKQTTAFPLTIEKIKENADRFIRYDIVRMLAEDILYCLEKDKISLILINGVGPFGHNLVYKYIQGEHLDAQSVHESVALLNSRIIGCFRNKVMITPISPFDTCVHGDHGFNIFRLWEMVEEEIEKGYVPSAYGDVIPSTKGRLGNYEVISGDDLAIEISKIWKPEKVIMVTDTGGVFTGNPKIYKDARMLKIIRADKNIAYSKSEFDVTGGIQSKVEKALLVARQGIKTQIINGLIRNNLRKALLGDDNIGTVIL